MTIETPVRVGSSLQVSYRSRKAYLFPRWKTLGMLFVQRHSMEFDKVWNSAGEDARDLTLQRAVQDAVIDTIDFCRAS